MIHKSSSLKKSLLAVALASSVLLSSCATTRDTTATVKASSELVYSNMEAARNPVLETSQSFKISDGFYAARSPITTPASNINPPLPKEFQKEAGIERPSAISLTELAAHITRVSGFVVSISPDVLAEAESAVMPRINFDGNLAGLLDRISGSLNLSWKWDGSKIEIYRYESKMFRIVALTGASTSQSSLDISSSPSGGSGGGSGGESGSSGSSGSSTSVDSNFDVWEDIASSIRSVLSPSGTLNIAPSMGIVTVRDTPDVLRDVEAQIREFNRIYSRQVALNVQVYSVERSASEAVGTNWTSAWNMAAQRVGLDFSSGSAGGLGTAGTPSIIGTINGGRFDQTQLIVNALSSIGKTALLTSGTVSTLNGQSVPLNISSEQAYLQSYSTTLSGGIGGAGATTTLTPGIVTGGFSMLFTPKILEDNKVMMRYSVNLSSIDAIETFESPDGNSAIQLPRRSTRDFLQNVSVRSGQTVVLAGFQQTGAEREQQGPFSPKAWLLGGKKVSDAVTKTIIIVVTPTVIE